MSDLPDARDARRADVVVAGSAVTAQVAVLALARELGPRARILRIAEMARPGAPVDRRSFAIAPSGRELLATLGLWTALAERAQPIGEMVITDSKLADPVRPAFLSFVDEARPGGALANMVEASALNEAIAAVSSHAGREAYAGRIVRIEMDTDSVRLVLEGGEVIDASLLVAADGASSSCRDMAGIGWIGWDYPQLALTGTLAHERDHEARAYQHFLPGGPFAILPLKGRRSSIVWTEEKREARRLLALGEAGLLQEIARRMGRSLGSLRLEGPVASYALRFGVARSFIGRRIALIGDAAHVIHPIAGQGLNMGLRDIAALAAEVGEAARLGLDIGSLFVLARYQRARRFDTARMGAGTDGLNRLFSNDSVALRALRDLGLGIVDRAPMLKRLFMALAAGRSPASERASGGGIGKARAPRLRRRHGARIDGSAPSAS